jgi:hypothetical protein
MGMRTALGVFAVLLLGCTGSILDPEGSPPPVAEDGTRADGVCAGVAGPSTRLVRMTHKQYDNTVRSLLFVAETPASTFAADSSFNGFNNNADGLTIGDRLSRDYQRAAVALSETATGGTPWTKLVTCAPSAECAKSTIASLVRRAFRRPPLDEEVTTYVNLFAKGKDAVGSGDDFRDGMRLVIEAVLQSPSFLYRVESSNEIGADGTIALNGYEVASRLSYMLWNDMPDAALFAEAEKGTLSSIDGLAREARRMIDDPRAREPVADFHRQWLGLDSVNEDKLRRDPVKFPGFTSAIAPTLQAETLRFVDDIFASGGGLHELLTAPFTYVNSETASLYGLTGTFGKELTRVELDPARRGGLLTQIGFLASHAYYDLSSPIHRGVFIQRQVLCTELPDPPGDVNLKLPPVEGEIKTTRQQVTVHTSPASCQGCHGIINPTGFAFENYDAIGKWRDTENGVAIDATGSALAGDEKIAFTGPMDFVHKLEKHPATSSCYAKNWLRFAYGRKEQTADTCAIKALGKKLATPGASIKDLLVELATSPTFRARPGKEAL